MRPARALVVAASLAGCASVRPHLTVIEPVSAPAGRDLPAGVSGQGGPSKEAASSLEKTTDVGNWFYRRVYQPDGDLRKLYAVEIIYCPTEKSVFTECRVAVAWSRDGKGSLGVQSGAPSSPVWDERNQGEAVVAPQPPPAVSVRPAPGPEPVADAVVVGGKDFLSIPATDIATIRTWMKRTISLSLTNGMAVNRDLKSLDASGIWVYENPIDTSGKPLRVVPPAEFHPWTEIHSVSSGASR